MPMSQTGHESFQPADNKRPPAIIDSCRIRWRLGWHGGMSPLQPRWLCAAVFRRLCSVQRISA